MHIASGSLFSYIFVNLLVATVFVHVPVNLAYELTCQPEGKVTSISGSGIPGFRDGHGERSYFNRPGGVAVSFDGSVYVADSGNNRIRRVSYEGDVTLIAGSGIAGFSDDKLLRAEFNGPQAIVITPTGMIFVADTLNNRIRLINLRDGIVSTYGGRHPLFYGCTLLSAGAGIDTYRDATVATQAYIHGPVGLAYHTISGDLFFSDSDSRIRVVRQNGMVETVLNGAGLAGFADATGVLALFNQPSHMALNEDESVLYIADRGNNRIRQATLPTMTVTTIEGSDSPSPVGTPKSNSTSNGTFQPVFQLGIRFDQPYGIAFYVEPGDAGEYAKGLSPKKRSALLVSEQRSNRLRRLVLGGNDGSQSVEPASFAYAGSYNAIGGHNDELGPASIFNTPSGISVAPGTDGGIAFVADTGNHMIRRVERELPTQLYISASNLHPYPFEGDDEYRFVNSETGNVHGYYSINGPPNNETSHVFGFVSYKDELHVLTMCAYPSLEYFVFFKGSIQVIISDVFDGDASEGKVYIAWKGTGLEDERAETFRLKYGGCTNPSALNYDPWAFYDDGSCVSGTHIVLEIKSTGQWGSYQLEGPGLYYSDVVGQANGGSYSEDTDVHILAFMAWPQVIYTAVHALMSDAVGQTTSFIYFNYSSMDTSSQHLEVIRPAGPGCTKRDFVNYSPFATVEDNSCMEGRLLLVDLFSASLVSSDWYSYGHVALSQPVVLGGQATLPSKLFLSANETSQATLFVPPGLFSLRIFGDAKVKITLGGTGNPLLRADGSDSSHKTDAHGFISTLGETLFHLAVPEKSIQRQVVSSEGGVLGNSESGSIIIGAGALESPTVLGIEVADVEDFLSLSSLRMRWRLVGKVFQPTPLRLRFTSPVTVIIPYDEQMLPTSLGNGAAVVIGASDERGVDWRVMPGATFGAGKVHVDIDEFTLLAVAMRPDIEMISPQRTRLSGGTSITLIGNDLCGESYSKVLCKYGNNFHNAQMNGECNVDSQFVICEAPQMVTAGFVSVDVHDASTLQNSESGVQVLFTSGEKILRISPATGPLTGGAIVMAVGMRFNFAIDHSHTNRMGDLCASAARNADPIFCYFDGLLPSHGFAISSALAFCELPPAPISFDQVNVRVTLSPHDEADGSFAMFKYRMPISNIMKFIDSDGSHARHSSRVECEDTMLVKTQTVSYLPVNEDVDKPEAFIICGTEPDPAFQCRFGTFTVTPLVLRVGVLQCLPPFMLNGLSLKSSNGIAQSFSISGIAGEPAAEVTLPMRPMRPTVLHDHTVSTLANHNPKCISHMIDFSLSQQAQRATLGHYRFFDPVSFYPCCASLMPSISCFPHGVLYSDPLHSMTFGVGYITVDVFGGDKRSFFTSDLVEKPGPFEIHDASGFAITSLGGGGVSGTNGGGIVWLSGSRLGSFPSAMVHYGHGSIISSEHLTWCEFGPTSNARDSYQSDFDSDACNAPNNPMDVNKTASCDSLQRHMAHIVSSALVACEAPSLSNMAGRFAGSTPNMTKSYFSFVSVSLHSNLGGHLSNENSLPLLLISEPILKNVSLSHTQSKIGGSSIHLSWQMPHDSLQSFETPWLACAFGTIAPVDLILHGKTSAMSGSGTCLISPHSRCLSEAGQSYISSSANCEIQVWIHLPCTGRARDDNQHFISQKDLVISEQALVGYTSQSDDLVGTDPSTTGRPQTTGLVISDRIEMRHFIASINPNPTIIIDARTLQSTVNANEIRFKFGAKQIPDITSVSPSQLPLHGHAILRVSGRNFWFLDEHGEYASLYCTINISSTIFTVVSSVYALCEAPTLHSKFAKIPSDKMPFQKRRAHQSGKSHYDVPPAPSEAFSNVLLARVELCISTKHLSCASKDGSHDLMAFPLAYLSLTTPTEAFANDGGSIINVIGHNFSRDTWHATCMFGTTNVIAHIKSATLATCVTPAHEMGIVQFAFHVNGARSHDHHRLNFTFA